MSLNLYSNDYIKAFTGVDIAKECQAGVILKKLVLIFCLIIEFKDLLSAAIIYPICHGKRVKWI